MLGIEMVPTAMAVGAVCGRFAARVGTDGGSGAVPDGPIGWAMLPVADPEKVIAGPGTNTVLGREPQAAEHCD